MSSFDFDKVIRKVPDFPKKGILFYDITSLIADPPAMRAVKEEMVRRYQGRGITKIVAVESRGFLFGTLLADALSLPLVLARKKGKLPNPTFSRSYALEYGQDTLEIQKVDLAAGDQVLLLDDLIATGGTLGAVSELIEQEAKAKVVGIFAVIGLPFLNYEKVIGKYNVATLINYYSE